MATKNEGPVGGSVPPQDNKCPAARLYGQQRAAVAAFLRDWRKVQPKSLAAQVEHWIKKPLFDCRMCGQCVLYKTAFVCPMRCPKRLRNGPCGGTRPGGRCEIDPALPCAWYLIYQRSQKLRWFDHLRIHLQPLDWRMPGTSSWVNLAREIWTAFIEKRKHTEKAPAQPHEAQLQLSHKFVRLGDDPHLGELGET